MGLHRSDPDTPSPSDYGRRYARWTSRYAGRPDRIAQLNRENSVTTGLFYAAYALLLLMVALHGALAALAPLTLIPGAGFAVLSLVRRKLNRPRPYEADGITPLIKREGEGCSFPSRHGFSAFAISGCWVVASPAVALCLLALAVTLGRCRVIGGVHYPRDVEVGAAAGLVVGLAAAAAAWALGA